MIIRKVPPGGARWHAGERYMVAIGKVSQLSENRTKVDVFIRSPNGNVSYRVGDGRQMGNFHPIWVSFRGKRITVEELLRMT